MVALAPMVEDSEARATRRTVAETPALPVPRFIVQHAWPCRWQLVDVMASSTAKSVIRSDYADFEVARADRDAMNAEYWAQVAL